MASKLKLFVLTAQPGRRELVPVPVMFAGNRKCVPWLGRNRDSSLELKNAVEVLGGVYTRTPSSKLCKELWAQWDALGQVSHGFLTEYELRGLWVSY